MCISYVTNYTVIYKDQGRILHGLQTTDTSILTGIKAQRSHRTITVSLLGLVTALAMEQQQQQQQLEKTWHGWLFSAFPLSCSTSAAMATQEAHFLLDRREFWKPSSSPRCWLHLGCSSSRASLQDEHFQGTERERDFHHIHCSSKKKLEVHKHHMLIISGKRELSRHTSLNCGTQKMSPSITTFQHKFWCWGLAPTCLNHIDCGVCIKLVPSSRLYCAKRISLISPLLCFKAISSCYVSLSL